MKTMSVAKSIALITGGFLIGVLLFDGAADAARLINGRFIKSGTVTSKQIKDHSVTAADLATGVAVAGAPGQPGPPGDTGPAGSAKVSGWVSAWGDVSRVQGNAVPAASCDKSPIPRGCFSGQRVAVRQRAVGDYCISVYTQTDDGTRTATLTPATNVLVGSLDYYASDMSSHRFQFLSTRAACAIDEFEVLTIDSGNRADLPFAFMIN